MEFLIGFMAGLSVLAVFLGGALVGWKAKERDAKHHATVTADELTESQKQQLRDEREAWQALHNYGVEEAYDYPPPVAKEG